MKRAVRVLSELESRRSVPVWARDEVTGALADSGQPLVWRRTVPLVPDYRVHARADADNVGSQRVTEKVRMVKEGVIRSNRVEWGETFDEAALSVLRREWEARSGPLP